MTIRKKFKSSIKRGTGEAYLILKEYPAIDFSKDIIEASLINFSYDNQIEDRTKYIFDLIQISNQKEKIIQTILNTLSKALSNEFNKKWSYYQLINLAVLFAKQDDKKAKTIIYKCYISQVMQGDDCRMEENLIMDLDGLEGLIFIAETKGKIFEEYSEKLEDSLMVELFQEENPSIKVYNELQKASETNKYIKIYIDNILKQKIDLISLRTPQRKRPRYTYELVSEKINRNENYPLPSYAANELSKNDIIKLANDFLKEKLRIKQEKYLRVFELVKYPYNYQILLNIAKRPYSSKDRLIEYAVNSIKFFKGKDIREFALKKIPNSKPPDIYTTLLVSNYKTGDSKILKELVEKTNNRHNIHFLASSLVEIYEANKTTDCKEPLIALYNKLICGFHRKDIVKILIENNVLPDKIKEEIKYDSYEGIRELFIHNE